MKVIDDIRKAYYQNFTSIPMNASFRKDNLPPSTISKVTQNSAIGRKHGELLFRLVCEFHPRTLIELGTSLGISTLYLATPNSQSKVFTIEGNAKHLAIAQNRFKISGLKNIVAIEGTFDEKLPQVLDQISQLDFVYIDGNHQQQATIDYFNQCLTKSHNHTVMAFHDIHWSKGMEAAWKHICNHPRVTVSIDTFHLGLVFLRKECLKQHFVVRF
jgi:predicted O-methyltransferase YrrM